MATTPIGKDNIALEKKKQSALLKAVKRVKKNPKVEQKKNVQSYRRGVIMLKHIPHGFYENEMRGYFSQFGRVLRIRVARSEKTGKSRGYAFVEFEFEEVAKIAAEAMNNYLMFERLIKCELLSPEVKSRNVFKDRHIREDNYPKLKTREYATEEQKQIWTQEQVEDVMEQRQKKIEEQNKKFAEIGIDYNFQMPVKGQKAKESENASQASKTPDGTKKLKTPSNIQKSSDIQDPIMSKADSYDAKTTPKKIKNLSPKLLEKPEDFVVESEDLHLKHKSPVVKKKELPRISPKMLRSRKSQGPNVLDTESHGEKQTPAKKSKDLPRISPKMLRSRKSQGPNILDTECHGEKHTPAKKSNDLPRISPKLLRSRKSQGGAALEAGNLDVKKTPAQKKTDLPKVSPKLLRSRKSDASAMAPLASKVAPNTPSKQKKVARKSVF